MKDSKTPLVSIICVTFNHEKYIRQALDSFLSQRTSFKFEIIIHDDASTDKTRNILHEYRDRYPEDINLVLQEQNQFSKGNYGFLKQIFQMSKGKYIAQCEGDDFWIDENKLQKQVDYMERHDECSISFHPVRVFFENGGREEYIWPSRQNDFTIQNLMKDNFIPANSVLYRSTDYSNLSTKTMPFDWYLHLYHAKNGKIMILRETMSAYRRHSKGIWWEANENKPDFWKKNFRGYFEIDKELISMYGDSYQNELTRRISNDISKIIPSGSIGSTDVFQSAIHEYPELFSIYISQVTERNNKLTAEIDKLKNSVIDCKALLEATTKERNKVQHDLDLISKSRVWRIRSRIIRLMRGDYRET